eukprot:6492553-Lingulodinium_polyedra.AAC.1
MVLVQQVERSSFRILGCVHAKLLAGFSAMTGTEYLMQCSMSRQMVRNVAFPSATSPRWRSSSQGWPLMLVRLRSRPRCARDQVEHGKAIHRP